eukprot:scaffold22.g6034.t1
MRSPLVLLLALGLCGTLARAQWTGATSSGAADPVGDAVTKMMAQLIQKKTGLLGAASAAAAQAQQAAAAAAASLASQAEATIAAYEAQYCTPAVLKPGKKVPATFFGHSFALTLTTGNCSFNHTKYLQGEKELDCVKPSISYIKTPANFTSHYNKATVFMEKKFGEQIKSLMGSVAGGVGNAMGAVGGAVGTMLGVGA